MSKTETKHTPGPWAYQVWAYQGATRLLLDNAIPKLLNERDTLKARVAELEAEAEVVAVLSHRLGDQTTRYEAELNALSAQRYAQVGRLVGERDALKARVAELEAEAEIVKPGRLTRKRESAILSGVTAMESYDDWDEIGAFHSTSNSPDIIAVYEFLGLQTLADERREMLREYHQEQREQKREEGE